MRNEFNNIGITRSVDFFRIKIPRNNILSDSIYILGKVTLPVNGSSVVCIDIPENFPAVISNKELRNSLETKLPILKEIEARPFSERQKSILLSAGSFIWFGDRLGLLRRDNKTPYKPLHLNQPIGRMDGLPSHVAMKELNEEMHLFVREQGLLYPVVLSFNGETGIEIEGKREKLEKLQRFYKEPLKIQERIIHSNVENNETDKPYFSEIVFSVAGHEIERRRMIAVFSEEMHTFEMNFSLKAESDLEIGKMVALSGEPMGRDVLFLKEEDLATEKLSASLSAYHQMRKTDHNPQIQLYRQFLDRCP
jgi:hypothetical protein